MKTPEEIIKLYPGLTGLKLNDIEQASLEMAMKEYAKQYLQEVATKLEPYDDDRGLLSQIPYRLMDEIDKQYTSMKTEKI